ncbi:dipeptide/oligopeptide/nickel ABC transporter ATP-binding protein [Kribbella solani]|uniref:ABC transporter ATP-binding protein n=1 Tax=Kribbella solani TaxID=236067 RepID=UPI0029B6D034|nr:dipeptide/oligopeptide/nickel ABC transporter ATP-binding protein [Kribbella solani]MDX3006567.1 dipeptide/oligopeptide/nickel ABC transporter ATP-binding protein [Kribbella solani]
MNSAVNLQAVTAGYRRGVATVRNISFSIDAGDSMAIVGGSGSGKTTIARLVTGLLLPDEGVVEVFGESWSRTRHGDLRRRVQMVFQDPYGSLNPKLTAVDSVADVIQRWKKCSRAAAQARAVERLEEVGLTPDLASRRPNRLSGGQCQRVGIARALAAEPELIVADEPTSALDVSVQRQVLDVLTRLITDRGVTLVLITHDLGVAHQMANRCLVLQAGEIVESGSTCSVLTGPTAGYTQQLIDAIPRGPDDRRTEAGVE